MFCTFICPYNVLYYHIFRSLSLSLSLSLPLRGVCARCGIRCHSYCLIRARYWRGMWLSWPIQTFWPAPGMVIWFVSVSRTVCLAVFISLLLSLFYTWCYIGRTLLHWTGCMQPARIRARSPVDCVLVHTLLYTLLTDLVAGMSDSPR